MHKPRFFRQNHILTNVFRRFNMLFVKVCPPQFQDIFSFKFKEDIYKLNNYMEIINSV